MLNKEKIKTFFEKCKEEFKDGVYKLIGWTIPAFVFVLLLNCFTSCTINNDLKISSINFEVIQDNMVLSETNTSRYKEINIQNKNTDTTCSYTYKVKIKGHGRIDSASVFYAYDSNNLDLVDVKLNHLYLKRIITVDPDNFNFEITYIKTGIGKKKRAYLVLKDAETSIYYIYLLIIDNSNGKVDYISESDYSAISPYDQNINEHKDSELYVALNKSQINKETENIRSRLK